MTDIEIRIMAYADARWPGRTKKDKIRKLGEEFFELFEAAAGGDRIKLGYEAADVAIVLVDLLAIEGMSLSHFMRAKVDILDLRRELVEAARREDVNEEAGT